MFDLFPAPLVYVQVFKNKIRLSVLGESTVSEEHAAFSHPRSLIGQFVEGQQALTRALAKAYPTKLLTRRPRMVIHAKELIEGGLTQIEERALMEMGLGAGAVKVKIWQGADLSPQQLEEITRR